MAVRAKQLEVQQPLAPQQPSYQPTPSPAPSRKKGITLGEKLLAMALVFVIVGFSISILHTQGQIQTTNNSIQDLEKEVAVVQSENVDLKVQVGELSRYERIWEKAQALGLTLNEKNVKVVPSE